MQNGSKKRARSEDQSQAFVLRHVVGGENIIFHNTINCRVKIINYRFITNFQCLMTIYRLLVVTQSIKTWQIWMTVLPFSYDVHDIQIHIG